MKAIQRRLLVFLTIFALGSLSACGDDPVNGDPDAGNGGANGEGSGDGTGGNGEGNGDDPPPPPPLEEVRIFYTTESTWDDAEPIRLFVAPEGCRAGSADLCRPGSGEPIEILPFAEDDLMCQRGCRASEDLKTIIFADPATTGTLRKVDLDNDYQPTGRSSVIATNASDFVLLGDQVFFRDGESVKSYNFRTSNAGDTIGLGEVAAAGFTPAAGGRYVFLAKVRSLTEMSVEVYDHQSEQTYPVYHFISGEPQGTGSFYSGRERMSLSPDGSRLAIVTDARTSGSHCSSNNDCIGPGESCLLSSVTPRCVRQELTLNIINLHEKDSLGSDCSTDSECGDDHFCDMSAPDDNAKGECMPARFSLGPSGPMSCANLQLGQYSGIASPLMWRDARTVVAVLTQNCHVGNIMATDLVALNLDGAAFERLVENPGMDHGQCHDSVEQCYDASSCNVQISSAGASPSGRAIALAASSPSTRLKDEVWVLDSFGRGQKELVTRSSEVDVRSVSVHPAR